MNKVIEVIKSRRSIRNYTKQQLTHTELNTILEAGRFAPTGMNKQPWLFTAVQNKNLLEGINDVTTHGDSNKSVFYDAPTIIIVSCDSTEAVSPHEDATLALGTMFLAAESLGIGSCWVYAIQNALNEPYGRALKATLEIPENNVVYAAGAFGHKGVGTPNAPVRKENNIRIFD